jgi:hypothetical protein
MQAPIGSQLDKAGRQMPDYATHGMVGKPVVIEPMSRLQQHDLFSLATLGTKACDAGGGALRP